MRATEINSDIRRGAGCLIYSKDSDKWLMVLRSPYVDQPMTWAFPGGKVERDEDYLVAALREAQEEIGMDLANAPNHLIYSMRTDWPLTVFKTYAVIVDKEFEPVLNWESSDYKWCTMDDMPTPLHYGVDAMLNSDQAAERLHEWLGQHTGS